MFLAMLESPDSGATAYVEKFQINLAEARAAAAALFQKEASLFAPKPEEAIVVWPLQDLPVPEVWSDEEQALLMSRLAWWSPKGLYHWIFDK
jgi:hypothetical protein